MILAIWEIMDIPLESMTGIAQGKEEMHENVT